MVTTALAALALTGCTVITEADLATRKDADGDGFEAVQFGGPDCDDTDPAVHPDAEEQWYDGVDQDCSGGSDLDSDGDGHDLQALGGDDCDDEDVSVHPGVDELCDGLDGDCDGELMEGEEDLDGDGWLACATVDADCDDSDAEVNPDADEICDDAGVDEDCDEFVDDADGDVTGTSTWFHDDDGDGWGDDTDTAEACVAPDDHVEVGGDCDDDDDVVHPETTWTEDLDGDGFGGDDGDTLVQCDQPSGYELEAGDCDDDDEQIHPETVWARDDDGDGFGDGDETEQACSPDATYVWVLDQTDCDDAEAEVNPDATETCSERDDDCDGLVDDQDDSVTGQSEWYLDDDEDGYGTEDDTVLTCEEPTGRVLTGGDCDDGSDQVHPDADEVCNGDVDDDCDGLADDDDDGVVDQGTWYADTDGDGFGDPDSSLDACLLPSGYADDASDCDDGDATRHPDATETWYDGVDQDCDEASDYDADGDGYEREDDGGLDCDDEDASISPDASEVWYDGTDQDCDGGSDYDADGDGYEADTSGGEDCDDGDSSTSPAELEVCEDGVDNDCDGFVGPCSVLADDIGVRVDGASSGGGQYYAGYAVAGPGDVDNDGTADLLIGSNNEQAFLFLGPLTADAITTDADVSFSRGTLQDGLGRYLAGAGDLNADGYADLLFGAVNAPDGYNDGATYVVLGPVTADMAMTAADATLWGETTYTSSGSAVASAGDVDGDGSDDVLVGAYVQGGAGSAYLVYGPVTGEYELGDASAILDGESVGDQAAIALAGVGDVDGDGRDDIVVGANANDRAAGNAGTAYLFHGPLTGESSLADADAIWTGEAANDYAGASIASGDIDGDGLPDLVLGAYGEDTGGNSAGAAYVVSGLATGTQSLASASAKLVGEASNDYAGSFFGLACPGDANADGYHDVLVGAKGAGAGTVYLVLGPASGQSSLSDAVLAVEGNHSDNTFPVAGFEGFEGTPSMLFGVPSAAGGAGTVFVVDPMDAL